MISIMSHILLLMISETDKLTFILRRNKLIWHGSFPDGRRDPSKYCDGWRSSSSSNTGFASDLRYVTVKIII